MEAKATNESQEVLTADEIKDKIGQLEHQSGQIDELIAELKDRYSNQFAPLKVGDTIVMYDNSTIKPSTAIAEVTNIRLAETSFLLWRISTLIQSIDGVAIKPKEFHRNIHIHGTDWKKL